MTDLDHAPRGLHHRLYRWVLSWASRPSAVPALFVLAFAESSFFPVPPDVLLIAMSVADPRRVRWFAAVCTVGSVLGGVAGYAIGYGMWHAIAGFVFDHLGGIGFTPANFALIQERFQENAFLAVFTAGFTPIPYKVFTIGAGVFDVALGTFVAASIAGRVGRFFLVAELVARIGPHVQPFIERYLGWLTLAFVALLIGGVWILRA